MPDRGSLSRTPPAAGRRSLLAILLLAAAGCGYHVAGKGHALPATLKVIAVPAFRNETSRFKVEQSLTRAIVRELMQRTSYQTTTREEEADAVLRGTITGYYASPVVFDSQSGRATTVAVNVRMKVALSDRRTGKVLWENADYTFSERYEISQETSSYFEESQVAMERLSRSLAASVVSAMLSAF